MNCLQVHDFITGTTIALPRRSRRAAPKGDALDIVRPNGSAADLVANHMARLSALSLKRRALRRAA